MEYVAHSKYPADQLLDSSNRKLKVKKITFASLKTACHIGYTGVSKSGWLYSTLEVHLKSEGLNHAVIRIIYDSEDRK